MDPTLSLNDCNSVGKKRDHDCVQKDDKSSDQPAKRSRLSQEAVAQIQTDALGLQPTLPSNHYAWLLLGEKDVRRRLVSPSSDSLVSAWLNSLSPDPEAKQNRSLSENGLGIEEGNKKEKGLSMSLPDLSGRFDADGFAVPDLPSPLASTGRGRGAAASGTPSGQTGSTFSAGKSPVEDINYRVFNLFANRIFLLAGSVGLPQEIERQVARVRSGRDSPGLSVDQVNADKSLESLENNYTPESTVEKYFSSSVFLSPQIVDCLKRSDRLPMNKYTVPAVAGALYNVSTPVPDMLYGYDDMGGFPDHMQHLATLGPQPIGNSDRLLFPFLTVEFKGEGGSLWVATNQCMGGQASCVNMIERLNRKLLAYQAGGLQPEERTAFGISMNGTEARIHVSWMASGGANNDTPEYKVQKIRSFCLQEADQHIQFRSYVRNILDWGGTTRLQAIRGALDRLLASNDYKAALTAKAEQPRSRSQSRSRSRSRADSASSSGASFPDTKKKT